MYLPVLVVFIASLGAFPMSLFVFEESDIAVGALDLIFTASDDVKSAALDGVNIEVAIEWGVCNVPVVGTRVFKTTFPSEIIFSDAGRGLSSNIVACETNSVFSGFDDVATLGSDGVNVEFAFGEGVDVGFGIDFWVSETISASKIVSSGMGRGFSVLTAFLGSFAREGISLVSAGRLVDISVN